VLIYVREICYINLCPHRANETKDEDEKKVLLFKTECVMMIESLLKKQLTNQESFDKIKKLLFFEN